MAKIDIHEFDIDPRSLTNFETEVKEPKAETFIEIDLKKQIWLLCQREEIDYDTLEWSDVTETEIEPKDPKTDPLKVHWRYEIIAKIPNPKTLGRTQLEAAAEYPLAFLMVKGLKDDPRLVKKVEE
jgi:hypothetical protein